MNTPTQTDTSAAHSWNRLVARRNRRKQLVEKLREGGRMVAVPTR